MKKVLFKKMLQLEKFRKCRKMLKLAKFIVMSTTLLLDRLGD